jgi:hypothetical protein
MGAQCVAAASDAALAADQKIGFGETVKSCSVPTISKNFRLLAFQVDRKDNNVHVLRAC